MNRYNDHELTGNTQRILRLLQEKGPLSVDEIMQELNISQATVSRHIGKLMDSHYAYAKKQNGKHYHYYRNKPAALKALKQEFQPLPSPVFSVTDTTLAVKIDPRFYRIYETEFWQCFNNENFPDDNELFAVTFSGDVMYVHLWPDHMNRQPASDASVLQENIELISNFFK